MGFSDITKLCLKNYLSKDILVHDPYLNYLYFLGMLLYANILRNISLRTGGHKKKKIL